MGLHSSCSRHGLSVSEDGGTDSGVTETPKKRLERHFDMKMRDDQVPLFRDFETYEMTLPVRRYAETEEYVRLCDLPFWAKKEDIEYMAKRLERRESLARAFVKYAAAPSGSGKTASVLVGFLASAKRGDKDSFTHYLYLAFANNNGTIFGMKDETKLSRSVIIAKKQGAAFALECLRERLFDTDPGPKEIDLDEGPPLMQTTVENLTKFLDENFKQDARILVHVDEHRKMCAVRDKEDASAAFRQGCMEALALTKRVTVMATYTKLPSEIPATRSSRTCRHPVPVPSVDIDQVIDAFPELKWPSDVTNFHRDETRILATLKFRLAAKLRAEGLLAVHQQHNDFRTFLRHFKAAAAGATDRATADVKSPVNEALCQCVGLCVLPNFGSPSKPDANAVKLLLGVKENEEDLEENKFAEQIKDVVVFRAGASSMLTSSLECLLTITDPSRDYAAVYIAGRDRL